MCGAVFFFYPSNMYLNKMDPSLQVGDWVNSRRKGIFRVARIVDRYYDESSPALNGHQLGDPWDNRIVISKRLLNSKFKRSFNYDACSEYFISPLDETQLETLHNILAERPGLLAEFDAYRIPPILSIWNDELQIDDELELDAAQQLIQYIRTGRTLEIRQEMERLRLCRQKPGRFSNHNFQLFNFDHEYVARKSIWRDAKITKK